MAANLNLIAAKANLVAAIKVTFGGSEGLSGGDDSGTDGEVPAPCCLFGKPKRRVSGRRPR